MTKRKEKKANGENKASPHWSAFDQRITPTPQSKIDRIIAGLEEYSKRPEAYVIEEFIADNNMHEDVYYDLVDRHEDLKAAHLRALLRLGSRRETGALTKQLDSSLVLLSLPKYIKKWKELAEWKASLQRDRQLDGNVRVQVEQVPSSDKVPEKKNE